MVFRASLCTPEHSEKKKFDDMSMSLFFKEFFNVIFIRFFLFEKKRKNIMSIVMKKIVKFLRKIYSFCPSLMQEKPSRQTKSRLI